MTRRPVYRYLASVLAGMVLGAAIVSSGGGGATPAPAARVELRTPPACLQVVAHSKGALELLTAGDPARARLALIGAPVAGCRP